MRGIQVLSPHMPPELLVAALPLDRLAGLPLFFGNAFQVAVACLVQTMIAHKERFQNGSSLPHGDDREMLDVQVNCHRHQIRITLALHDLFGLDLFGLAAVQFCCFRAQDQLGTLLLPALLGATLLKIPAVLHGIGDPGPLLPRINFEPDKALAQIEASQFERKRSFIEGRVIGGPRQPRLSPFLAGLLPIRQVREIGSDLADGILDDRSSIDERQIRKGSAEVPGGQRMGMFGCCDRLKLRLGEQFIGREQSFPHFLMLLREVRNSLGDFFGMSEEEGYVEGTRGIQDLHGLRERGTFFPIRSSLIPFPQIKQEFGRSAGLSH